MRRKEKRSSKRPPNNEDGKPAMAHTRKPFAEDISDQIEPRFAVEYLAQFGEGLFKDDEAAEIVDFVEGIKDRAKGILVNGEAWGS